MSELDAIVSTTYREVGINGKKFTVAQEPAEFWKWVEDGKWESSTFALFDAVLKPETSYVDVGAWIGPMAIYAANLSNHCWAIEPDPIAYQILLNNLAANNLNNVATFEQAIMDFDGFCNIGASGLGCSVTRLTCRENSIKVPCTTLRSFIDTHQIPDPLFIKIDVEGAESRILKDIEFFRERKPTLHLGTHRMWWEEGGQDGDAALETIRQVGSLYKYHYNASNHRRIKLTDSFVDVLFTDDEF